MYPVVSWSIASQNADEHQHACNASEKQCVGAYSCIPCKHTPRFEHPGSGSDWSNVLVSYLAAEISSVTLRASLHILRVFLALLPLHKRAHAVRSAAGNGWSPWLAQLWQ